MMLWNDDPITMDHAEQLARQQEDDEDRESMLNKPLKWTNDEIDLLIGRVLKYEESTENETV